MVTTIKDNESSSSINRRTVLQSASVSSLALAGPVKATSTDVTKTGKSVAFNEVMLTHEIELTEEPNYNYPYIDVDDFSVIHSVDEEQSKLYLNDNYLNNNKDPRKGIPNQKAVVASGGYSPLPVDLGGSAASTITTELYENYRVASELLIKDSGYMQPEISVAQTMGGLSVTAEGQDIMVPDGTESVLTLPEREITIEVFEYTDEAQERDGHRLLAPSRNYVEQQVTITPKIHARNRGELDVRKVSNSSPVPHPPQSQR